MPCDTLWRSALSPSPRLRLILPPACRDAGVHQPPSHRAGAASSTGRSSQDLSVPRGPLWLLRPTFVLRMADLARRVHAPSLPSSVGPRAAAYPRFYQSNATLWRAAASPSPPRFFFCVPAGLPRRPRQPTTPPPPESGSIFPARLAIPEACCSGQWLRRCLPSILALPPACHGTHPHQRPPLN